VLSYSKKSKLITLKKSQIELLLILPFFFLDEKETKNQGSEFLFCLQIVALHIFTTRCKQF
jgi:hypothetical protein